MSGRERVNCFYGGLLFPDEAIFGGRQYLTGRPARKTTVLASLLSKTNMLPSGYVSTALPSANRFRFGFALARLGGCG